MTTVSRFRPITAIFCTSVLILFLFALPQASCAANGTVSGRYLRHAGGTVILQLAIGSPAPQAVIVEQFLPAGTRVVSSAPPAQKINARAGVIKWLLIGVRPGRRVLTLKVAPAEAAGRVSAILRYRTADGGEIVAQRIVP